MKRRRTGTRRRTGAAGWTSAIRALAAPLIPLLLLILTAPPPCRAEISAGREDAREKRIERERALSGERTRERGRSSGERSEGRREESREARLRRAAQEALELLRGSGGEVAVDTGTVLRALAARLEKRGVGVFGRCRLITRPPALRDLIPGWEPIPGMIDPVAREHLESAAAQGAVAPVRTDRLREIVRCALDYARTLGTAAAETVNLVRTVGPEWLGVSDVTGAARMALERALRETDPAVDMIVSAAEESFAAPCRFRGDVATLLCGGLTVRIRPLAISLDGREILGETWAGIRGEWRLSSSRSLRGAWERFLELTEGISEVRSAAEWTEKLEREGRITRASLVRKKVLSQAVRGSLSVKPKTPN